MAMKTKLSKRLLSLLICAALLLSYLPLSAAAATTDGTYFSRAVDSNTMDLWKEYFDLDHLDTTNAGGIWADKSVFTDASAFGGKVSMLNGNQNFLTALSAIAANKEISGYSTVPTDTVLVLDLSNSMPENARTQLIQAANNAIKTLQEVNNNNRVGVVLYSGDTSPRTYSNAVTRLMPLDRYTTSRSDGNLISFSGGNVGVYTGVSGASTGSNFGSKEFEGATYIQAGLWEAYKMFDEVDDSDIVIGNNNWQAGEYRMPIVVLMSDGAPTMGASNFADVENQTYGRNNTLGADVGDGSSAGIQVGQGFLVQLTASYIKNRIENKYKVHSENGAGRSLFYTLGFNLSTISNQTARNVANSVLNPDGSTLTDSLWATYNNSNTSTMSVSVEGRSGGSTNVTVTKNSYATSKSYVDEYFSASGTGLTDAFDDIVEEIILQSRYYPTHLEGGSPDLSGYVTFTDRLGEYMEVKHINGILLGDTLFDGHMMASKLADSTESGLGTPENPTALGNEFIRSVKTRLGIADTADAQALVAKAYNDGQLRYNSASDWSNYIAWYAKADGTYAGFYDEDGTETVPEGAVYINRSYGFLGETSGSIKNSDMMYMSVLVQTSIETGEQTVIWKIPAALVPMITYIVTLQGINIETATDINLTVENKDAVSPIRLIYETGLRSDLNAFNITRITEAKHMASDGHTRIFWNNYFDISAESHDQHITALAEFTPNKENERFYYTFDSAVYKKSGENYVLLGQSETPVGNGEYYHRRYIFKQNQNGEAVREFYFERISSVTIGQARWVDDFELLDHQHSGAWVIPKGTPARELQMYDREKEQNLTDSAHMIFHPYLSEHNNIMYVDMNLGNNGRLAVTPATGIKISKTVDIFETGTSDTFKFRISAALTGSFDSWITGLNDTPSGAATTATFTGGVYEFEMKKDQTFWISGIPAGTAYVVEEISENADYKVKSVHVNGISTGKLATGAVAQYLVDDVHFVNTAVGEGDLVITKQVLDASGAAVDINANVKFTAEVTLTDVSGNPLSGTYESSAGNITLNGGKYTVSLAEGESFVIRGLPEETRYSVVENNIPNGFALDRTRSVLSGVIDASANDQALIVNTYLPTAVNAGDVEVLITKQISGGRTQWLDGESYTFLLEAIDITRAVGSEITRVTIDSDDSDKSYLFSLVSENYTTAGTYYYRIAEVAGAQGGITYDTAERRFSVVVADSDMDGDLEIVAVNNELNTVVSGTWNVAAVFNNVYAPTGTASQTINIKKIITGNHPLNGYQFALYNADPRNASEVDEIVRSPLTNAAGETSIRLTYSPQDVGKTYTYYLAEVNGGMTIQNIQYSQAVYPVEVTVRDNLDGTISAEMIISGLPQGTTVPTFENVYVPSASDFVTISGKKEIQGDRALNANEFAFSLEAVTSGAPMPAETVVYHAANGSFTFGAIEFGDAHKGQSYQYKVTEVQSDKIGGFTYDETEYFVTVTVTDNGDQTITATVVINDGTQDVDDIVFTNVYDATDAEVTLAGTKLLTGKTLQDNEFQFSLYDADGTWKETVKNKADGSVTFTKLTFSKAGVYRYRIVEEDGGSANYDYDQAVYTVEITVTDNSQGVLTATTRIWKDGVESSEIVFRNGFIPTPISYDLHTEFVGNGVKELDGRPLKADEFRFVLINAITGKQIGDPVTNAADGTFKFPAVVLNAPGIHHYKIVEELGDEKGVTYDPSSYHIRLEVVQNEDGVLSVHSKQLYKGVVTKQEESGEITAVTEYVNITDGGKVVFHNTYRADPVALVFQGMKKLEGRTLAAEEFSFTLYDHNGTKLETVKNAADGTIAFTPITVEAAGEYLFTVREEQGSAEGITYDAAVYTIKATVTDNLDGTFAVVYAYQKDSVAAESVQFVNIYTEPVPEIPEIPEIPEVPKTGDAFHMMQYLTLLALSGGGIVATMRFGLKKKEKQDA